MHRLLALEAALHDDSDVDTILSITRGRALPEEHRQQVAINSLH